MDILNILSKQKVELDDFTIDVDAERDTENTPSLFTTIHVIFNFKGKELNLKKIERAVALSMDKYCSVTKILEKSATITYEIVTQD